MIDTFNMSFFISDIYIYLELLKHYIANISIVKYVKIKIYPSTMLYYITNNIVRLVA